mmetsp:Transcript_44901/g.129916  ORF Transcript_44901/g.129916 Transcript_44901/m.129916 type:complete len:239 (-) Transcript_44901:148-864(-)
MAEKKEKAASSSGDAPQDDAVDAMGRKVWDKDFYSQKAMDNIMMGPQKVGKRRDPVIPLPSSQRTFLKQRSVDLQLDKTLGQSKVVTQHTIKPMQGGYWCSVCECLIKDSSAYLEHVNGRRHNRNLGMNMKVEKIGVDRVKEKLEAMRKKSQQQPEQEDVAAKIQAAEEAEEDRKRRKKEKKKKKRGGAQGEEDEEEDGEEPAKKGRKAEAGQDEEEEEEETEEMKMLKQMGLPTGFG